MKNSSRFEEDKNIAGKIIKIVRNIFRLKKLKKKKTNGNKRKDVRNLFRLRKKKIK